MVTTWGGKNDMILAKVRFRILNICNPQKLEGQPLAESGYKGEITPLFWGETNNPSARNMVGSFTSSEKYARQIRS